jgi:ABC-type bacteriocin/lantibiotic exporter with double-glycine peptidase domain
MNMTHLKEMFAQVTGLAHDIYARVTRRRRVPVIHQLSETECGAACLAMILSFYGRKTSVSECRDLCMPGRDGLTALTIVKAARSYGLRVKAYTLEPENFKYVSLPAVVHWKFNHFIVVESWTPKSVTIVDPGGGRRRLSAAEFNADFTGVVLTFEPGAQFTPRAERASGGLSWHQYIRSMFNGRGAKVVLMQVLIASLLLQLLGFAFPLLTKVIIDHIIPYRMNDVMPLLGLGMLVLVLAQTVTSYLRSLSLIYLRGRLDTHVMQNFFEHLLSLPFSFFQRRTSGDLLMRLGSNSLIREMLTNQTLSILLDGSFVVVYLFVLLGLAPSFALLVLGLGGIQMLAVFLTRRQMQDLTQRELAAKAEEQSYLVEALKGIAVLKSSGAEPRAFDRWSDLFFQQMNVSIQRSYWQTTVDLFLGTLRVLSPLTLLWVGAHYALDGRMSIGTVLAMNALAAAFLAPLGTLISNAQQLQTVGAHLERISDILDAEPEASAQEGIQLRVSGHIEVKNVSFQYDPQAQPVLRDVSFTVEPGQKVAFIGPTGSGKSTLAMLLLGLYQPTAGEILYDGVPIQEFNSRELRTQFGVVMQDPFLFSGSIRQNIALNNPDITLEEVVNASMAAGVHEDIAAMPMNYETIVSEGGSTLSGGQRQRIAIARALAHNPSVLLLDEATSHLDANTEADVDHNLNNLSCTRIVIAHRLSTISNADQILVFENGSIIERGTSAELMKKEGHYAQLVRRQWSNEPAEVCSL